jgi:hypothetical protein
VWSDPMPHRLLLLLPLHKGPPLSREGGRSHGHTHTHLGECLGLAFCQVGGLRQDLVGHADLGQIVLHEVDDEIPADEADTWRRDNSARGEKNTARDDEEQQQQEQQGSQPDRLRVRVTGQPARPPSTSTVGFSAIAVCLPSTVFCVEFFLFSRFILFCFVQRKEAFKLQSSNKATAQP